MTHVCLRKESYFELLLCNIAVVWVQELKDMRDQISAAEVISSQCREQHSLGFAANLKVKV